MKLTYISIEAEGAGVEAALRILREQLPQVAEGAVLIQVQPQEAKPTNREPEVAPDTDEAGARKPPQKPLVTRPSPIRDLILRAMASGADTVPAITDWMRQHGLPEYEPHAVLAHLTILKTSGQVKHLGQTWRLKV